MIHTVVPTNKEHWLEMRKNFVNSTEVSILFGLNKYKSLYEFWHEKKGITEDTFQENERSIWGSRLESSIAQGAAEDLGIKIRHAPEYKYDDELRMGSSFDYFVVENYIKAFEQEGLVQEIPATREVGILEIKNVDGLIYKNEWIVDVDDSGTIDIQATPQIELQLQAQLAMTGFQYGYIGALVSGNTLKTIRRERDEEVIAQIKEAVRKFWKSIDENQPPEIDYETDSDFIISRYGHAEPGSVIDLTGNEEIKNLALEYKNAGDSIKALTATRDTIKAQLLQCIGTSEKAKGDGFSITAGLIGPCVMNYTRDGYRNFRINWSKKKAE